MNSLYYYMIEYYVYDKRKYLRRRKIERGNLEMIKEAYNILLEKQKNHDKDAPVEDFYIYKVNVQHTEIEKIDYRGENKNE